MYRLKLKNNAEKEVNENRDSGHLFKYYGPYMGRV